MAAQPSFTWTVPTGTGSVNSSGLYTAPAVGTGAASVRATVGSVNSSAGVNVVTPAWLGAGSAAVWNSANATLTVTGATSIVADPGSDQPIILGNGSSAVVTINPAAALQIHLGGLSLSNGSSAVVASLGVSRTATNHRVLVLGLAGAASAPLFSIDSTSKLDLTDNDLVDHAGSFTAINTMLQSGLNTGAGYWNGSGINSSAAAAGSVFTLSEGQAFSAGTFDNETVATSDVEIRYSYYGDATLDGHVDGSDYSRIDNGVLGGLSGFNNGDFNYDGVINGSDYTLIDNAFNVQGASLSAQIATPAAEVVMGVTSATPTAVLPTDPSLPAIASASLLPSDSTPAAQGTSPESRNSIIMPTVNRRFFSDARVKSDQIDGDVKILTLREFI
jgi:hypothetical protein